MSESEVKESFVEHIGSERVTSSKEVSIDQELVPSLDPEAILRDPVRVRRRQRQRASIERNSREGQDSCEKIGKQELWRKKTRTKKNTEEEYYELNVPAHIESAKQLIEKQISFYSQVAASGVGFMGGGLSQNLSLPSLKQSASPVKKAAPGRKLDRFQEDFVSQIILNQQNPDVALRRIEKSLKSIKEVSDVTLNEKKYRVVVNRRTDYDELLMEFRLTQSPQGNLVIQVHQMKGSAIDDFYMTLAQFSSAAEAHFLL